MPRCRHSLRMRSLHMRSIGQLVVGIVACLYSSCIKDIVRSVGCYVGCLVALELLVIP
jgi:hypothetical protein